MTLSKQASRLVFVILTQGLSPRCTDEETVSERLTHRAGNSQGSVLHSPEFPVSPPSPQTCLTHALTHALSSTKSTGGQHSSRTSAWFLSKGG